MIKVKNLSRLNFTKIEETNTLEGGEGGSHQKGHHLLRTMTKKGRQFLADKN